ncbi:peptide-methionine (R)-S-oxide reductase MsrB [Winogradskyella maritima]|uniref:peptide-methionine (R)-S-oxide reductase n=1 Tax=Winogradskyella maritima TaxID=1517766 RepID=A0ABV8AH45_9FLAO|nr:peptide-methionine (R)-S-oxide reductase MsrB [Winogradskyella maritima]
MNWNTIIEYIKHGNPEPNRRVDKTDDEWRAQLTPEQYRITRQQGTERAHTGALCSIFEDGKYSCVNCKTPLFDSFGKFNSSSGWPSFTEPVEQNAIKYIKDKSHGMLRVETVCNTCDAHLGHVFPDGPGETGLRFCINSEAIVLEKASDKKLAKKKRPRIAKQIKKANTL